MHFSTDFALDFAVGRSGAVGVPVHSAGFNKSELRMSLSSSSALAFATAALCVVCCVFSLTRKGRKRCQMRSVQAARRAKTEAESINLSLEKTQKGGSVVSEALVGAMSRDVVGAYIIGALALPAWHVLPVFLDLKLALDPALPGLTDFSLAISCSAIFLGWLVSATVLDKALVIFSQKELLLLHVLGLLLVTLATLLLPHMTAGNLVVFTTIRFVYGLLMNITALQFMYIQERLPLGLRNPALVFNCIIYCLVVILMAFSCSQLTSVDWRLEAFLWYAGPLILALAVGFPDCWPILRSLPKVLGKKKGPCESSESAVESGIPSVERRNIIALAVGFLACGCGFYGLTYSAGQLSPDIYMSSMLLHGGDIFGYILALSADKYGRNNVQAWAFFVASMCLLLCSAGEPGTPVVLSSAVVGRLALDVCFMTVYLALAQIFSRASSKLAFTVCETTARVGGIIAPMSGTWPTAVSCPIFASVCLAAAFCTMTLPEGGQVDSDDNGKASDSSSESLTDVLYAAA